MKLIFTRLESGDVKVSIQTGDCVIDFDYAEMVKSIYRDQVIEDAELVGAFSPIEEQSIKELVECSREALSSINTEQNKEDVNWSDLF